LTHSPPASAADLTPLSREQAAAAFDRENAPEEWLKDKARLAILSPPGLLVSASPAMLALFGAKDREALEARLVQGDGPSARRLRRLAATLAFDEAPRLEQMRLMVDRRLGSVNLHCARMAGPGGANWLLVTAPALGAASGAPLAAAKDREAAQPEDISAPDLGEKPVPHVASPPSPNARFLWTLDEEGRFGAPHPVLVAAVGTNSPDRGESLEAFFRRVGLDRGDELVRVVGERETFSRVSLEWPLWGLDRRRLIALSAAPMFGRQREFLGYRGFGVLGEEIDAVAMPEGNMSAELAGDDRSALPEAFEPEPQAPESAARPVESSLEFAGTDSPDGPPSFLDADGIGAARTEAFEPEPTWPTSESEAEVQAPENAGEPVERNHELPAADATDAPPPEASLEAEGPKSASALIEASDSDAPSGDCAAGFCRALRGEQSSAVAA
jgi:hypothetical protein